MGSPLPMTAAAEGDHPALPVEDGEDDAVPEAVVEAAAGPGHQQAGVLGRLQREAAGLQMAAQRVPFLHGIAQMKGLDDLRRQAPLGQVVPAGFTGGAVQGGLVKTGRHLVDLIGQGALAGLLRALRPQFLEGQRDAVAPGQLLGRLREAQALVLHQKGDDVAPGAAAETIKNALLRGYRERRAGVGVEGAESQKIFALLDQLDVLAHHLFDAGRVLDLQELVFRDKRHGQLPVVSGQWSVFGFGKLFLCRLLVAQAFQPVPCRVGTAHHLLSPSTLKRGRISFSSRSQAPAWPCEPWWGGPLGPPP